MTALSATNQDRQFQNAYNIPGLKHDEAGRLAAVEAQRLVALIESLVDGDWDRSTDCTEWTVRDIVAHLAGAVSSQASWTEFKRQNMGNPYMKEVEMKIDAINRRQVEDRSAATNEELVAEFRENAPKAVRTRQRLPWPVGQLRLPMGPPLGFASIGYVMDTIFTRDQWMHRHDIALATGREMIFTPEHDGRIQALVVRDLGRKLEGQLKGQTIDLLLGGQSGSAFCFGSGSQADAVIEMDTSTFNRLASGRLPAETALDQATIEGDQTVAAWFLNQTDVPY
jgi:uncharacterized protein (TIGR03083 family)